MARPRSRRPAVRLVVASQMVTLAADGIGCVDGEPVTGEGLDLVRDRYVGVQVRITGPGITMHEPGRDHAPHRQPADTIRALPGEQRPRLQIRQRVGDGLVVHRPQPGRQLRVGNRPQCRDGLGWGEGEVESGDRHPGMGDRFRDERVQLPRPLRWHAVLGEEPLSAQLRA